MIDLKFSKINILFSLSFENEIDRRSFSKYYTPTVTTKDYNWLIDGKRFFDFLIKNKEETYEQLTNLHEQ